MKTVLQNLITTLRQDKQPLTEKLFKIFALQNMFTSISPSTILYPSFPIIPSPSRPFPSLLNPSFPFTDPDYELIAQRVATKVDSIQHFRKLQRKDLALDPKLVPYIKEILDFVNFLNFFILEKTARELDLLRQVRIYLFESSEINHLFPCSHILKPYSES